VTLRPIFYWRELLVGQMAAVRGCCFEESIDKQSQNAWACAVAFYGQPVLQKI